MEERGSDLPEGTQQRAGCNVLFLALLVLAIGALAFWGWRASPPSAPTPAGTAAPKTMPAAPASAPAK